MSSQGPASSTDETNFGYTTTTAHATGSADPPVGTVKPRGFTFALESIRDASDYTEFVRQSKTYTSYVGPTAPLNNRPDIYGCWFRLQYLLGRHKQGICTGTAGTCGDGTANQIKGELGDS